MRDNIKNAGLILAIIIAGISFPTSVISIINRPTQPITEVNNYYYNNTVIERNNNTIIVWVNNTVVVNETVVEEEPIPDRSEPIEEHTFHINTTHPHYMFNYMMGTHEIFQFVLKAYPMRAITYPRITVVQSSWIDFFIDSGYKDGDFFSSGFGGSAYWSL